jgi:acetyl-CoA carboxylase carboxyl transferase subunit alpha
MADQRVVLDFEKPVAELEAKLRDLERLGVSGHVSMDEEVALFKKKLDETKLRTYAALSPWQRVQLARHPNRPYTMDYIERLFTDFLELHGDRRYADDAAIVGGFAKLDGRPVLVLGTQKGRNTRENVLRNFGCPHPEGYRKALRIMQLADKSNLPIFCLIDTPGAFPGIASEERHIGEAIAVNLREMFQLSVPIVVTVIGEGGSGGALGIGIGNRVLLLENAYYSVITPEGCAAILWKDRAFSAKAAESLKLTATDLAELDIIDDIVKEPLGGAHQDVDQAAALLKEALLRHLGELDELSGEELREQRYRRFRKLGVFNES